MAYMYYYSPDLKKGGYIGFGLSAIPSVRLFVHSYVRPSVGSFVIIIFRFRSISSEPFYRFSPNFVCALILSSSSLGLLQVIFPIFVPKLWPLIYVQISFPFNILRTT